jgi:hypothetical protein
MSTTLPLSPKGDRKKGGKEDNPGGSGAKDDGVTSYLVLTKTNYSDWACLMKVKLKARALWRAIDVGGVDQQEEMRWRSTCCAAPFLQGW